MCGIAGILHTRSDRESLIEASARQMARSLAHRGPDAEGVWTSGNIALGHRRLSIIDLSEAGCQPMEDVEKRFVIVYNGEVYNYLELRRELQGKGYVFRTETDSEVVLRAYREWGVGALDRFNGMWAMAIWDRERRELFVARDRAGKKPFYYLTDCDGTFYFASEVRAFRSLGFRFGLNPQAAFDFLTQGTYGHLHGAGFFAGLHELPPAHYFIVRAGEIPQPRRYWDIPVVGECDRLPYDMHFQQRFRELLTDAVALRLRSDVPVGATLSGGLDSSTLVLCMDEVTGGAPVHLFTSLYPGTAYDETKYFDSVVSKLERPIVHRVTPPAEGWEERLGEVLDHQEEPFGDTSIVAHYHLMAAARAEGVPVILSGQGGDELLMGYPSMVNAYLGHLLAGRNFARARTEISAWARNTGQRELRVLRNVLLHTLPLEARDRLRSAAVARLARRVTPALRELVTIRRFDSVRERTSFDSYVVQVFKRFSIPHLTHYDDRNAMAFAVEGRMPFLDYRLVELLFSVAYEALFREGFTKRVLRDAFRSRLPDEVRLRTDKIGFYTPLALWLTRHAAWIAAVMEPERVRDANVLQPDRYWTRFAALRRGDHSAALEVWRGFILHLWMKRFDVTPLQAVQPQLRRRIGSYDLVAGTGARSSVAT